MPIWRNKVWVSCCLMLGLHQISQKAFGYNFGLLDNYLDPFLSMPILLGLILQERRFIHTKYFHSKNQLNYHFSILEIVIATFFFAIIFEEVFPKWSVHFTKDYRDYLAYFVGAFIFLIFINKRKSVHQQLE